MTKTDATLAPANGKTDAIRNRGNISKVEPIKLPASRSNGNGKHKVEPKAKAKPAKVEAEEAETLDVIEVKNRKGKTYSLPANLFSHTGALVPFANAKAAIDFVTLRKAKSKDAIKKAKAEYIVAKAIHNTMICILHSQLGKSFELRRLTVRRLVKTPHVKAVAMAGRTEANTDAIEAFAQATAQGQERRDTIKK